LQGWLLHAQLYIAVGDVNKFTLPSLPPEVYVFTLM
jgi:hypothetical protein